MTKEILWIILVLELLKPLHISTKDLISFHVGI